MIACAGAQEGKQVRWAVLAGSGLPKFKSSLSCYGERFLTLRPLDEAARAEVLAAELQRSAQFSPAEAQAVVDSPAVRSMIDFTLGLPLPLEVALQAMLVHKGLKQLR